MSKDHDSKRRHAKTGLRGDDHRAGDDRAAFHEAMQGVRRLRHDKIEHHRSKPPPRARFTRLDEEQALAQSLSGPPYPGPEETGEAMAFERPGLARKTSIRLRRGQFAIESECDLHGMTAEKARLLLNQFLDQSLRSGYRCVRVIHGKGRNSGIGGPVIKPLVASMLRRHRDVLAYCSALPAHGGSGAVYVLLARY